MKKLLTVHVHVTVYVHVYDPKMQMLSWFKVQSTAFTGCLHVLTTNKDQQLFNKPTNPPIPSSTGFSVEAGNRRIPPAVKTKVAACAGNEICLCVPIFFNEV